MWERKERKTAYEIGHCDWSSDVCSSDLSSISSWELKNASLQKQDKATCLPLHGVSVLILFLHPFMPSSFPFSPTILFPNFTLLYFILFKIFPLVVFITPSPSCCSYHEITYLNLPLPNHSQAWPRLLSCPGTFSYLSPKWLLDLQTWQWHYAVDTLGIPIFKWNLNMV